MIDLEEVKKIMEVQERLISSIDLTYLHIKRQSLYTKLEMANKRGDQRDAKYIGAEIKEVEEITKLCADVGGSMQAILELYKSPEIVCNKQMLKVLEEEFINAKQKTERLEIITCFRGKYDKGDAIIEIHAGAGGVDAQDWAEILSEMYLNYAQKNNLKVDVLDKNKGDIAGIKSLTMKVYGEYAYGALKYETGVHRLVRNSPFDSKNRRHTSFASVQVLPSIEKNEDIVINPEDLKIETFRSGGAGGQNVNKTESAVRITHLPTGIVVACQNERSQMQNKEQALSVLVSKLTAININKQDEEKNKIIALQKKIEWGNQIRSYVFSPYTQVKDNRTDVVVTNVYAVLDGELSPFINAELKKFSSLIREET